MYLRTLPKSSVVPLGLTAAASATYAAFEKKIFKSEMTTLLIQMKKTEGTMKVVKSLDDSDILIKSVTKAIR